MVKKMRGSSCRTHETERNNSRFELGMGRERKMGYLNVHVCEEREED